MFRTFFTFLFSLIFLFTSPSAHSAECEERACIDVYTQDGHIVIEGRKGKGPTSTHLILPPKPSVTKKATISPKPKVRATKSTTIVKRKSAPVVKKVKRATKATSLQDKLIESLPTAGISYQPSFEPLVATPVFLWSDIPTLVTKKIEIVGEMVEVSLRPTFFWHYGDGTFYVTRKAGAPFPDGEIRHIYRKPGHYLIELITKWDGAFTIAGVSKTIPGEITTVSVLPITIVSAPIRFMN